MLNFSTYNKTQNQITKKNKTINKTTNQKINKTTHNKPIYNIYKKTKINKTFNNLIFETANKVSIKKTQFFFYQLEYDKNKPQNPNKTYIKINFSKKPKYNKPILNKYNTITIKTSTFIYKAKTKIVPLVWTTCSIVALVGVLFGMDIGVISGVLPFITKEFKLSTTMAGWIVGSMMGGAAIGVLATCVISQQLGRKKSLLVSSIVFFIGAVLAVIAQCTIILIIARIIIGLSVGSASFIAPLYLAEVTPKSIRGMTISLYQFMVTIGILIAFISNLIFSYFQSWRCMFGILIAPTLILFCGILLIPDSPRWLASINKKHDSINILKILRPYNIEVTKEIQEMFHSITNKNKIFGWTLFKQNINFRRSVVLGIVLQFIQQFTGMNVMMYFSPKIFELSGFIGTNNQLLSTLLVGLVNVLSTILAIILVDKLGRKPILYIGFSIMAAGMTILSFVLYIGTLQIFQYLSIMSLLIFVAGFAMSAGPIIWIICAEIQPLYGRDFGISCSTIANWLANMLLGTFFLTLLNILGGPLTFIFLALANISFVFFTIRFIPETKGTSLEQIEKNLMNGKSLRNLGK